MHNQWKSSHFGGLDGQCIRCRLWSKDWRRRLVSCFSSTCYWICMAHSVYCLVEWYSRVLGTSYPLLSRSSRTMAAFLPLLRYAFENYLNRAANLTCLLQAIRRRIKVRSCHGRYIAFCLTSATQVWSSLLHPHILRKPFALSHRRPC